MNVSEPIAVVGVQLSDRGTHPAVPSAMRTRSGAWVDLVNPQPGNIFLSDIAFHLSQTNRWVGATQSPIPVTVHSIKVAELLREKGYTPVIQFYGLMHDAHEAYMGDLSRPLVRALVIMLGSEIIPTLERMKHNLDVVIRAALGIREPDEGEKSAVKWADTHILNTEFASHVCPAGGSGQWLQQCTAALFLDHYQRLAGLTVPKV